MEATSRFSLICEPLRYLLKLSNYLIVFNIFKALLILRCSFCARKLSGGFQANKRSSKLIDNL